MTLQDDLSTLPIEDKQLLLNMTPEDRNYVKTAYNSWNKLNDIISSYKNANWKPLSWVNDTQSNEWLNTSYDLGTEPTTVIGWIERTGKSIINDVYNSDTKRLNVPYWDKELTDSGTEPTTVTEWITTIGKAVGKVAVNAVADIPNTAMDFIDTLKNIKKLPQWIVDLAAGWILSVLKDRWVKINQEWEQKIKNFQWFKDSGVVLNTLSSAYSLAKWDNKKAADEFVKWLSNLAKRPVYSLLNIKWLVWWAKAGTNLVTKWPLTAVETAGKTVGGMIPPIVWPIGSAIIRTAINTLKWPEVRSVASRIAKMNISMLEKTPQLLNNFINWLEDLTKNIDIKKWLPKVIYDKTTGKPTIAKSITWETIYEPINFTNLKQHLKEQYIKSWEQELNIGLQQIDKKLPPSKDVSITKWLNILSDVYKWGILSSKNTQFVDELNRLIKKNTIGLTATEKNWVKVKFTKLEKLFDENWNIAWKSITKDNYRWIRTDIMNHIEDLWKQAGVDVGTINKKLWNYYDVDMLLWKQVARVQKAVSESPSTTYGEDVLNYLSNIPAIGRPFRAFVKQTASALEEHSSMIQLEKNLPRFIEMFKKQIKKQNPSITVQWINDMVNSIKTWYTMFKKQIYNYDFTTLKEKFNKSNIIVKMRKPKK